MNLLPKNSITWKLPSLNFPENCPAKSKKKVGCWYASKSCEYFKQMLLAQADSYQVFGTYDTLPIN